MALTEQTKEWVYLGATGLVPTFLHYTDDAGVAVSQPTISEEANGYYSFDYGTITQTIHWAFNPVGEVDHAFNTKYFNELPIAEKQDIATATATATLAKVIPHLP